MMDTPTGIATIFSEVMEVHQRRTSIHWVPDAPRAYHTDTRTHKPEKRCLAHNGAAAGRVT